MEPAIGSFGTLVRFLPIVTQIFLWGAVFSAIGTTTGASQIASYSYRDLIAYFLLTMISRAFSIMAASGVLSVERSALASEYDHDNETATPYAYEVLLEDHDITYLPVDRYGLVSPESVASESRSRMNSSSRS